MTAIERVACAGAVACALAGGIGVATLDAQPSQPIYVQYDGFVRNKDGGYTLAFGYYNMNNVDVTVPPGESNSFVPAPGDRNQPTVFLKGRHRFACSMVVDKTFDGRLQWSVAFAGKKQTTTAKLLDPLYELELNSEKHATQGLDIAGAARNVCVNRAPHPQVSGTFGEPVTELNARVGQELAINALAEDDGLPRGSKVTVKWAQKSGPADVTFSSTTTGPTRVKFAAAGVYELELSASDGEKTATTVVKITVAE